MGPSLELLFHRHHQGNTVCVEGVGIEAAVINVLALLHDVLDLAQGHVLTHLQLDEILLSVDDLKLSGGQELTNVSRVEPALAVTLSDVDLVRLLLVLVVAQRDVVARKGNLTTGHADARVVLIRHLVTSLLPIHQFNLVATKGATGNIDGHVLEMGDGASTTSLSQTVTLSNWNAEDDGHEVLSVGGEGGTARQHGTDLPTKHHAWLLEDDAVPESRLLTSFELCQFVVKGIVEEFGHERGAGVDLVENTLPNTVHDGRDSSHDGGFKGSGITLGPSFDLGRGIGQGGGAAVADASTDHQNEVLSQQLEHVRQRKKADVPVVLVYHRKCSLDPRHSTDQISMADYDPLGVACSAAGVHDHSDVILAGEGGFHRILLPHLYQFLCAVNFVFLREVLQILS
eukprot:comp23213_c0_seq1/m.37796 comp23213_c0_seq1/g.37796  ORF comp23213_c0_seq1/g.37796 comp23213_c0_seq1/m.37796 type:complete len:400 (+) comp23213_c0_seq1:853-2052(+)